MKFKRKVKTRYKVSDVSEGITCALRTIEGRDVIKTWFKERYTDDDYETIIEIDSDRKSKPRKEEKLNELFDNAIIELVDNLIENMSLGAYDIYKLLIKYANEDGKLNPCNVDTCYKAYSSSHDRLPVFCYQIPEIAIREAHKRFGKGNVEKTLKRALYNNSYRLTQLIEFLNSFLSCNKITEEEIMDKVKEQFEEKVKTEKEE